tara:strand:- start:511 stop:1059 length:549 start_codon:yes stop_codon:yes gene_type:complete
MTRISSADIRGLGNWNFDEYVGMLPEEGNLLEIGSLFGKSAVCWAETFERYNKNWNIHAVDLFAGFAAGGGIWSSAKQRINPDPEFHCTAKEHLEEFKRNTSSWDNITWQRTNHIGYIPKQKPDALFYDGDHSYIGMKDTMKNLWDIEFIFVDDCHMPETVKVLEELGRPFEIKHGMAVING